MTLFSENHVPPECSRHILSFLELPDCLALSSASSRMLGECLPDLVDRCERMKQPYGIVRRCNHHCSSPTSVATTVKTISSAAPMIRVGLIEDLQVEMPDSTVCVVFPTVQDRVEQLACHMPSEHPSLTDVMQLRNALRQEQGPLNRAPHSKQILIDILQKTMAPLRLHDQILRRIFQSKAATAADGAKVSLHEYIGDVLCLTYLLQGCNKNCSFAEGSPCLATLTEAVQHAPPPSYISQVLMHSSILRTKAFTAPQRAQLGIPDFQGYKTLKHYENKGDSTTISMAANMYQRLHSVPVVPMECFRTEVYMASTIALVYNDFGPLGPSFRGRDIVRVEDITAHCLYAYLISLNNSATRVATDWLMLAHQQASKTRPMTVRAPMIRLSSLSR